MVDRWTWEPSQLVRGGGVEAVVRTFAGLERIRPSGSACRAFEIELGNAF